MDGFYRVAAAVPFGRVADVQHNREQIKAQISEAEARACSLLVFPELCLSSYTCGDLFLQHSLLDACLEALDDLCQATEGSSMVTVLGLPLRKDNRLYNCAVVVQDGSIFGVVPKTFIPNYKEYYEKRWFSSAQDNFSTEIEINGELFPFGTDLIFKADEWFKLGVEICEDLWAVIPPSSQQSINGSTVTANLSASNDLVTKAAYRRDLVRGQSARCMSAYVYSSAGVGESSTDLLFSGHSMISENGSLLAEGERYQRQNSIIYADVDCMKLSMMRLSESSYPSYLAEDDSIIQLQPVPKVENLQRQIDPQPFVPANSAERDSHCQEIFNIQASALAKRLEHSHAKTAVIGISGGLDSTLALLVTVEAMRQLGRSFENIITVTMPGYGTSERTCDNARELCQKLQTDFREIDIRAACEQHMKDIGHDPKEHDVTYENVQARERTQILMNLANKHDGLVIGTGDMSELALGWCTYNGDHMSMYAVNCSIPKTLVQYLIQWVADQEESIRHILEDILDTPITPELLPTDKDGNITQHTEKVVGPYELHDFFLYHHLKYGAMPERILALAALAYEGKYNKEVIEHWLTIFYKRFFAQQFKRSCIPDGPKVGTISLSPRGDWRMPSDAVNDSWLKRLK